MDVKKVIIDYLKSNERYIDSDNILIEELLFNLELLITIKEDINSNGFQLDVTRDADKAPFFQLSRSMSAYQMTLRNILTIFTKLTLSPQDRAKLKILLKEKDDLFSDIFNSK